VVTEGSQRITVGADRGKLLPTHLADMVTDFLMKYFASIMDYEFTARAEEEFDDIAEGKTEWREALERFYERFHPLVEKSESAGRSEAAQARKLGDDPKTGRAIYVRYGRYGPVLQLGEAGDDVAEDAPKPIFAPLPEGLNMDEVTLEQALPMFKLPRTVGQMADGQDIKANIGRFGPYVQVGKLFVSIKGQDPMTIAEDDARRLIEEKIQKEKQRIIADYGKIKVLNGPYGPYVTDGKTNAKIPKGTAADTITEPLAKKMLAEAPKKPKRRFRRTAAKS